MAAGYRDINTAKTVFGSLQKWPAKAGGCSPKGPAVAGTTVALSRRVDDGNIISTKGEGREKT